MGRKLQRFELFYLLTVIFILVIGILHFVLLMKKVDRELNISFVLVTLPALIAYGFGAALFSQISIYWLFEVPGRRPKKSLKFGLGFAALFVLAIGSLITQLMLALKFDLIKNNYTFTHALLPVLIAFAISSIIFIVNLYVGAGLAFPFFNMRSK